MKTRQSGILGVWAAALCLLTTTSSPARADGSQEDDLAQVTSELQSAHQKWKESADELSKKRHAVAGKLARQTQEELADLLAGRATLELAHTEGVTWIPGVPTMFAAWAATVAYAGTGRAPYGRGPSMAIMDRVRRAGTSSVTMREDGFIAGTRNRY